MIINTKRLRHLAEQVIAFRQTLSPESDRCCALMAGAFLDERLRLLIEGSLINDPKIKEEFLAFNGPVGTFSSRIDYAYLTGWIPKSMHSDLHSVRKIRNEFGHTIEPIDFTTPRISQRCNALQNTIIPKDAHPRKIFTNTCFGILSCIDIAIVLQAPQHSKKEIILSREEKEASYRKIRSKITTMLDEMPEEQSTTDLNTAKRKIFEKIITGELSSLKHEME